MTDLISVIIPIYKVEAYLERCVNSVRNQTYDELEIILVDDGSPDQCGALCDDYKIIDKRIKVIHKENGGLSDARNYGIANSSGDLLFFLDSDDWLEVDCLEVLYNNLVEHNADISSCDFIRTSDSFTTIVNTNSYLQELTNLEALELLYTEFGWRFIVAWGKLYKKHLFDQVIFPKGRIHEDEFTTYLLLYKANKIVKTNSKLMYYFQRDDNITSNKFNFNNRIDNLIALEERYAFFKEKGLNNLCNLTLSGFIYKCFDICQNISEFNSVKSKIVINRKMKENINIIVRSNLPLKMKLFYYLYTTLPPLRSTLNIFIRR